VIHLGRESGRPLQAAGRTGAGGHGRWGRGEGEPPGREVLGEQGHIRREGMVEVMGVVLPAARGEGV
jgi:hypothetical protein